MAAPRRMMALLAFVSLSVLVYGGIYLAFSVPVTDEMSRANRVENGEGPEAGVRAIVVPVVDPRLVATFLDEEERAANRSGAFLVLGTSGTFPAGSTELRLVRALAWVQPDANGTYEPATLNLTGVPGLDVENATVEVDVAAVAQGMRGFVVKADAEANVTFASLDDVVGHVARFEPPARAYVLLAVGGAGFLFPLLGLIATHRGAGASAQHALVCRECRTELTLDAAFCQRCGAWIKEKKQ